MALVACAKGNNRNKRWNTVTYRLINNGLSLWCLLLTTHQNSKPLLMNRYTTVTHIIFY